MSPFPLPASGDHVSLPAENRVPATLKILSYNIHKGFTAGRFAFKLAAIREAVRELHPDLVLLQEVQGEHRDLQNRIAAWPEAAQFEFMADQFWPHFAYGKNAVYDAGHHGNAILSKFPFAAWDNIDISSGRFERRGLLHGVIPLPGRTNPLHVLCIHLDLFESGRRSQLKRVLARIDSVIPREDPLIIAGDFNDWRVRATRILTANTGIEEIFLKLEGRHARTFPSWRPVLPLDRVYFRGLRPRHAHLPRGKRWNALSDHLPVCCEFEF
jgi:endonuclease/exonuclease/phosphatase family metal-dependent hydrolase